jgi:sugar lactone lactonase YvrE
MRGTIAWCAVLGAVGLAGCAKDSGNGDTAAGASAAGASTAAAATSRKLGETAGLKVPESVRYDSELDVYYISNVNGNPSQKDNNGFIVRVRADSTGSAPTTLVEGGKGGVTLNAPKGMAIKGDTLYVADIDAVRMFNRKTGASLGSIDLRARKATFLNDVVVGPDGVYITDTGIVFDAKGGMTHPGVNRIFKLVGKTVSDAATGDSLASPNGIAWDAANNRFLLAPFGGNSVQTWSAGQAAPANMISGPGQYDGIEIVPQGILVSSWADSAVHIIHGGTHMATLVSNVSAPADIGVDTKRNVVAIPRFNDGKVEYYSIP